MQNNLYYVSRRTQRSNYQSKDVFVVYPVGVISVAVPEAVVKQRLFPLVFVVLYNGRSISLFQLTVIQSFGVCLQINCVVTRSEGPVVI